MVETGNNNHEKTTIYNWNFLLISGSQPHYYIASVALSDGTVLLFDFRYNA